VSARFSSSGWNAFFSRGYALAGCTKIDRAALSNGPTYKILLFEKFAGSQTGLFGDLVSLYTDSIAGQILFYFFSVHRISVHLLIKKVFTPLHPVA